MQDAYREALDRRRTSSRWPTPTSRSSRPRRASRSIFKATVPVRPEVELGDYTDFNFAPEIETSTTPASTRSSRSCATRTRPSRRSRTAARKDGDYAVIGFVGTRDGAAVRGRHVRPDAAHPRPGAAHPGLRGEPRRAQGRRHDRVRHHLPRRLRRGEPGRPGRPLRGRPQGAAREDPARPRRRLLRQRSATSTTLDALRTDIRTRLEGNALDRARHEFADRIIEYAVANATVELPDVLVDQEVEVMHDEFRLARAPGHHRGGVPQGDREDRGGPARRVPAERRAAGQDPARAVEGRRRRGRRRPRGRRRGRGRPGPRALRQRPQARSRTSSPSGAARSSAARSAGAGSSRRSSIAGWSPTPSIRRCRTSRTTPASAVDDEQAEANASIGATDPGADPRRRPIEHPRRRAGHRRPDDGLTRPPP